MPNRILTGDNPFGIPLTHYDHLREPQFNVPGWSETHYWAIWNPDANVGVYVHLGTDPQDITLWWAQVFAYLPGGMVVADRSFGRSPDRRGPNTGNFQARCTEPLKRWTLHFDGAGELLRSAEFATRLAGAGPSVPLAFDVEMTATMPIWDLYKAVDTGTHKIGGIHHEQVMTCTGTLHVGGKQGGDWRLDGVVSRDHSSGARDLSEFGGDNFFGAYFPNSKRSLQTLIMWDRHGKIGIRSATLHQGDEMELITDVEMTGLEFTSEKPASMIDAQGNPRNFFLRFTTSGEKVQIQGESLHYLCISLFGANTNVNVCAINEPGNPLINVETPVRLTWPDGEIGYGQLGRAYKADALRARAK